MYPNSDQAASVLDVLRWETERLGIRVLLSCQVSVIKPQRDGGISDLEQPGNASYRYPDSGGRKQGRLLLPVRTEAVMNLRKL